MRVRPHLALVLGLAIAAAPVSPPREARLSAALDAISAGRADRAQPLLERLARDGSAVAETLLGTLVASGRLGPADPATAAAHYYRAAQRGHAPAQLLFARALARGAGVVADPGEAAKWAIVAERHGTAEVRVAATRLVATLSRTLDRAAIDDARVKAIGWRPWAAIER